MKKIVPGLLAGLVLIAMTPVWAGEVYVPWVGQTSTKDGQQIGVEVRVTNDAKAKNDLGMLFIAKNRDGTLLNRANDAETVSLKGNESTRMRDLVQEGKVGFLEISSVNEVGVSARLRAWNQKGRELYGAEMPVISKKTAIAAGSTANVLGLKQVPSSKQADFYLLNLGTSRATCGIEVYRRLGLKVFDQVINVAPLSMTPYVDVFSLINDTNVDESRIAVTCDQSFYPFAIQRDLISANVLFVAPSAAGKDGLNILGTVSCPEDALLHQAGVFHVPVKGNPTRGFVIKQQGGLQFRKLTIDMKFTHGGWVSPTSNMHNIFWFQRNATWTGNLFGYLNAHGPNKNRLKLEHNVDLPRNSNRTAEDNVELVEGETYQLHYVYDTLDFVVEAVISTEGGVEVARVFSAPTVSSIVSIDKGWYFQVSVDQGHGPENTTWGWKYADLCIQLE